MLANTVEPADLLSNSFSFLNLSPRRKFRACHLSHSLPSSLSRRLRSPSRMHNRPRRRTPLHLRHLRHLASAITLGKLQLILPLRPPVLLRPALRRLLHQRKSAVARKRQFLQRPHQLAAHLRSPARQRNLRARRQHPRQRLPVALPLTRRARRLLLPHQLQTRCPPSGTCSRRRTPALRPLARPPRPVPTTKRAPRHFRLPRQAAGTGKSGSTPRRTFIIKKAPAFMAARKRANT